MFHTIIYFFYRLLEALNSSNKFSFLSFILCHLLEHGWYIKHFYKITDFYKESYVNNESELFLISLLIFQNSLISQNYMANILNFAVILLFSLDTFTLTKSKHSISSYGNSSIHISKLIAVKRVCWSG